MKINKSKYIKNLKKKINFLYRLKIITILKFIIFFFQEFAFFKV